MNRVLFTVMLAATVTSTWAIETIPPDVRIILENHCVDCHDRDGGEGGVGFSPDSIDWADHDAIELWESIHNVVSRGLMPPPDDDPPAADDRARLADWVSHQLMHRSPLGRTSLRRLSSREYRNTIAAVFGLNDFQLPDSFPVDNVVDGFDNQAESMVVAAAHLEAMTVAAVAVADEFFPPPRKPVPSQVVTAKPSDLTISYSSAMLAGDAMRLASSGPNLARNATWPAKFEAPARGRYQVQMVASSMVPVDRADLATPAIVVQAHSANKLAFDSSDEAVSSFDVVPGAKHRFEFDVTLERGQTLAIRYANGPFDYTEKDRFAETLSQIFIGEPHLAAAWDAVGNPARGGSGWDRVVEQLESTHLAATEYSLGSPKLTKLVERLARKNVDTGETLVFKYFAEGPYVAIHELKFIGPIETLPDREDLRRENQRRRLLGPELNAAISAGDPINDDRLIEWLRPLLSRLFRQPADDRDVHRYLTLVRQRATETGNLADGFPLAIRTALIDPRFLFRGLAGDDAELATRLAYFLTSGPPDDRLAELAGTGRIANPSVLAKETRRLVGETFAADFTHQWLGLSSLNSLMPDARLIKNFTPAMRATVTAEVANTFAHVLGNNLPAKDLIAPDFVFTDPAVGGQIYQLDEFASAEKTNRKQRRNRPKGKSSKLQKVAIDSASHQGGLLGMPAVMMATANGVDTQPVLRGVWVMENLLGMPPLDPPESVPALTPDTQGASTPKQRLAAHMADASCSVCHQEIDPLGFALENFDPIGRWRDHYPAYVERDGKTIVQDGALVDASGTLPPAMHVSEPKISDVRDLKRILAADPRPFVRCLSEKWMTYATGRELNHREKMIVAQIVDNQAENDYRLMDLLVALVQSDVFR